MPRATDAKTRFVETAARLFRRQGYNGVGLAEIIAESGAPKGSFYHHFPGGKEELAEAVIALAGRQMEKFVERSFSEAPSFAAGCAVIAETTGRVFAESGYRDGCPLTAVAIDATPQSARLTAAVEATIGRWQALAAKHAERFGLADGAMRAERFFVAIEGAWIVARMRQSTEPFAVAAAMAAYSDDANPPS